MNAIETPLERLNYYNGQRLEAEDFRLEQDYHIRVRRWLNRSTLTYGIASGLEVLAKEGDPHTLVVTPGVALDAEGREIILMETAEIAVIGIPSETEGVVFGNYLTIRYAESLVARQEDGCYAVSPGKGPSQRLSWGGPARVRAEPVIEWQNTWPADDSGMIVLAQVELDETCAVRDIRTGVRRYVSQSQPPRALAYALEGEKDIDHDNPKLLYFHVRGGRPDAVTLYLRGAKFSSLLYTEMGNHTHAMNINSGNAGAAGSHDHTISLGSRTTNTKGNHRHELWSDTDDDAVGAMEIGKSNLTDQRLTGEGGVKGGRGNLEVKLSGEHDHTIDLSGASVDPAGNLSAHSHNVSGDTGATGANTSIRTGGEYTYLQGLQIWLDGTNYTGEVESRLGWAQLGDGTQAHNLQTGTGPISLDTLGVDLNEGEHVIELRVASGGGRIIYNLYVE